MTANYNFLAPVYDSLAVLVFGKKIEAAQCSFISVIPEKAKVMVVGGGSGVFLPTLAEAEKQISINYIEQSAGMIKLASQREGAEKVHFIQASVQEISPTVTADVLITHFFLDQFEGKEQQELFAHLNRFLKPGGLWICADFLPARSLYAKLLHQTMLLFFRLTTGIRLSHVPDVFKNFEQAGFKLKQEQFFSRGLIRCGLYEK